MNAEGVEKNNQFMIFFPKRPLRKLKIENNIIQLSESLED